MKPQPPNPRAVKCEGVEITQVFTQGDGRVCEVDITVTRDGGSVDTYTVITE